MGAHLSPSRRESDILGLITQGLTNKEIASRLRIALSTVNQHIHHLLLKLGAANRTQLAIIALRGGLPMEADSSPGHSQGGVKAPGSGGGQAPVNPGPIRNGGSGQGLSASRGEPARGKQAEPPRRAA